MDAIGAICAAFNGLQERRGRRMTVPLVLNAIIIIEFPFDSRLPPSKPSEEENSRSCVFALIIKQCGYLNDYVYLSPNTSFNHAMYKICLKKSGKTLRTCPLCQVLTRDIFIVSARGTCSR